MSPIAPQGVQIPNTSTDAPADGNADRGGIMFDINCSFCHGRGGRGGNGAPNVAQSKLLDAEPSFEVAFAAFVRQGRPEKGMPQFATLSNQQVADLAAYIKILRGRKLGVNPADLQTGSVEAGKVYFNGAGRCSTCHSPMGDLAGVASRYVGTELMHQMLYPKSPHKKVTVTLPSGRTITGTLEYVDSFTVALRDAEGFYHSWFTDRVKYSVDAPVDAHAELLRKHRDSDIHNLMAYLQTLVAPEGQGKQQPARK